MRWLFRWVLRLVLVVVLFVIALMLPVAYVEFACTGDTEPQPYASILPPEHHRPEARTLLTYPEWHIVHAYDDYAEVIKTGDPHDFGYVRAVRTYWSSLCALKKQSSAHGGTDFETKRMVYVIGVSFTAELAFKAVYEETLGRVATWIRGPEQSPLDQVSYQQAQSYAKFLQQVPWHQWDFDADIAALDAAKTDAFRDRERRFALGGEFAAKSAYGAVIADAVANLGADELTLRMIVTGADAAVLDQLDGVTIIEQRNEEVEIETIRYRALTGLLVQMAQRDVTIVEMAGNDDILFTAIGPEPEMNGTVFSFPRQGYGDTRHLFMVKVPDLLTTLKGLQDTPVTLEHVHDY